MSLTVVGVDPGTRNVGIAVVDVTTGKYIDGITLERKRSSKENIGDFLRRVRDKVGYMAGFHFPIAAIACEEAHSNPGMPKSGLEIAKCLGVVALTASEYAIDFQTIVPSEWKKAVTGKAIISYEEIKRFLQIQLKGDYGESTEHVLAAIGIALAVGKRLETKVKIEFHA